MWKKQSEETDAVRKRERRGEIHIQLDFDKSDDQMSRDEQEGGPGQKNQEICKEKIRKVKE